MVPSILILLSVLFWPFGGYAQTTFYKDKTIRLVAGTPAGSVYDLYARMVAQFIGKYIPGNPNVIVQNIPGSPPWLRPIISIPWPARRFDHRLDPTRPLFRSIVGRKEVQFDWKKFTWIGNTTVSDYLLYMRSDTPYKTVEDIRKAAVPPNAAPKDRFVGLLPT